MLRMWRLAEKYGVNQASLLEALQPAWRKKIPDQILEAGHTGETIPGGVLECKAGHN